MAGFRAGRRSVWVEGLGELDAKLGALPAQVQGHALLKAVEKGADVLEPDMIRRARKRSGNLARNIETKSRIVKPTKAEASIGPNKKAWYGIFLELGTKKMTAKPFMRPAFYSLRRRVVDAITVELRARILRLTRGR